MADPWRRRFQIGDIAQCCLTLVNNGWKTLEQRTGAKMSESSARGGCGGLVGIERSAGARAGKVGALNLSAPDRAKGRCPPEDIGGPWGYGEFLEALTDPAHERHRELKEWSPDDFNPDVVDVNELAEAVAELAQRWSQQTTTKRRRTAQPAVLTGRLRPFSCDSRRRLRMSPIRAPSW
jgi:hypothetical protein